MLPAPTPPEALTLLARAALAHCEEALATTRGLLGLRMSVRRLHVLLAVLELERGTLTEIADRVEAPVGTVWVDLQALGESSPAVPLGRNLVFAKTEDPGPRVRYFLTLQGQRLMRDVVAAFAR